MAVTGTRHVRRRRLVALGAAAVLAPAGAAGAQSVIYTGHAQFTTGEYGLAERTSSFYFASGLSLTAGRLRASASVPLVAQDAALVQYSGGGMVPSGGQMGGRDGQGGRMGGGGMGGMMDGQPGSSHFRVGVGDPLARLDFEVVRETRLLPAARFVTAAKAPLSPASKGFGTGEWDYGAGVALAKEVGGGYLFADATYWRLGDSPSLDLRNPVSYAVSAGRPLGTGRVAALATLASSTRVLDGVAAPVQAGGGLSYRSASGRGVSASALFGLTSSAPGVVLGVGWWVPFE